MRRLVILLLVPLIFLWLISLREVRLKIGDYYYEQGNFDQAVNWYEKVVRKEALRPYQSRPDQTKYNKNIFKLKSALVSLAKDHLHRISNSSEPDVSDPTSLDGKMREYGKIAQLFAIYRKHFAPNFEEVASTLNGILNEIETKRIDFLLAFGGKYIQKNMWKEVKYFFTKRILGYMDPISTLEKLGKLYGNDYKMREKIWGGDIFVTLEDFEDTNKPILKDWARSTEPTVNIHTISSKCVRTGNYSEYFDLSYGKSGYDYWAKSVNIPLSNPDLILGVRLFIKSKEQFRCSLRINIVYPKQGINGVWQTDIHKNTMDGWEERRIDNLYDKARLIAFQQGWDMNGVTIDKIIVNTQGFSDKFYVDDVELYLIKIDKTLK